jgi:hypothetical protein
MTVLIKISFIGSPVTKQPGKGGKHYEQSFLNKKRWFGKSEKLLNIYLPLILSAKGNASFFFAFYQKQGPQQFPKNIRCQVPVEFSSYD